MFWKKSPKTTIPIEQVHTGSHGDHSGGVFGFAKFKDPATGFAKQFIEDVVAQTTPEPINPEFVYVKKPMGLLEFRMIGSAKELLTGYPVLHTKLTLPVKVHKIREWSHVGGIEAVVEASGHSTFAVNFFAVDYLANKTKYISHSQQIVELAGIGYSLVKRTANNWPENFSPDLNTYMPDTNHARGDVIAAFGKVLKVTKYQHDDITGMVVRLQLLNGRQSNEQWQMDVFYNLDNIDLKTPKVGMQIFSTIWVQGSLVN